MTLNPTSDGPFVTPSALDPDGNVQRLLVDADGNLLVNVVTGGGGGSAFSDTDESAFIAGASQFVPTGGVRFDAPSDVANGETAAQRITPKRAVHSNLRENDGSELGVVTNPIRTDPTGTTEQPVSVVALPLPTGASTSANQATEIASLASIDGKTPALGQALAGASVPVVLTAAQLATLTPPAAITGFATETTLSSLNSKVTAVNTGAVVVSSSALPSGAATAAKQPALGTAGTASADVLTIQGLAAMTPIKTDGSAVTQPVSAASLPLPTGAATSANQATEIASLASIDGKIPALGQALAAASTPVVLTAAQLSTLTPPTSVTVTQGTGTNLHTVVDSGAVTATLSAETTKVIGTVNIASGQSVGLAAGTAAIGKLTSNSGVTIGAVELAASQTVGLAAGSAVVGKVSIDQTTPGTTNLVALAANQSVNVAQINGVTTTMGNGASGTGVQRVTLASDSTGQVAITSAAVQAKGTQNSSGGIPTQDLKDSGRTSIILYATAAAAGTTTTETAISLTKSAGTGATSAANSWVVTSGKRFRIQNISVATRGNNTATAQTTTFNFRMNTAGAVATNSTPVLMAVRSATPATANAWDRVNFPIPDGYEILGDGTLQIGMTAAATYTTNAPTWDVTIIGYEY